MRSDNCILFTEDIAAVYDETRPFDVGDHSKVLREVCEKLLASFGSQDTIELLDLGSGTGRLAIPLAQIYHRLSFDKPGLPLLRITCVERSESMMLELKKKAKKITSDTVELICDNLLDIRDLYKSVHQYDACLAHWIFHVIYDWRVAVYSVDEVLKPKGLIFLFEERGDLYDAIDGDLRRISPSPALDLWRWYHELRAQSLDAVAEPGSILPPRYRLGTMVVDERFEHMFRALGWTQSTLLTNTDEWTASFKTCDLIEQVIRKRAFTNMRLVRNHSASIAAYNKLANDLTNLLKKPGSHFELDYNFNWLSKSTFSGLFLQKTQKTRPPLSARRLLIGVIRDTLGRRTHRRGEVHLNSDVLWSRLFRHVWERLNRAGSRQGPLLALRSRPANSITAILAQAPFISPRDELKGFSDMLVLTRAQHHETTYLKLAWQLLTKAIEAYIPLEIIFESKTKQPRQKPRLKLHPSIHRLVVDADAQRQLEALPQIRKDCDNLDSIPFTVWDAVSVLVRSEGNNAIPDLLQALRQVGVLPLHNSRTESTYFIMALSVLVRCRESSTMYAFPFRTIADADVSASMGIMFCGKKELEYKSLEYIWSVSEIVFNEYIEDVYVETESYIDRLKPCHDRPTVAKWQKRQPIKKLRTFQDDDNSPVVLIVVAVGIEFQSLLELSGLKDEQTGDRSFPVGNQLCVDLGFQDVIVWATLCAPGSEGSLGSQSTVSDLIATISEKRKVAAVIMPGIAFGLKQGEQRIGDILLSMQIRLYEPAKIADGGHKHSRPIIPEANSYLVSAFRVGMADWQKKTPNKDLRPRLHAGLFLSGGKLVNDHHMVFKLKQSARHAIGGEMEGAGVYSAAARKQTPWIIVKSICDWGMQKVDDYQLNAAKNSADFVYHVLATRAFTTWVNNSRNVGC